MGSEKDLHPARAVDTKIEDLDDLAVRAQRAKDVDESLPLGTAFRQYKKALAWSILVSMVSAPAQASTTPDLSLTLVQAIVMESYGTILVSPHAQEMRRRRKGKENAAER